MRQGALADAAFARAHGHQMPHPGEPVGDAGALFGNLLEDPGPPVTDDVVVALHGERLAYRTGREGEPEKGCAIIVKHGRGNNERK